ncbi:hypothetical protein Desgi_4454 [Desulfoscipio gibsoniae DSM 7213]|uniref:Uncharacterized protein n=1 Tax=Desulfoscipio gibsoniae DSM 7213 TaxID=767817 RepID=R4KKE6_9FIRM|nr:hypothetical protein Desgi_4454 [Desulfoscipio gibsoniae DSM 7213]
MVWNKQQKGQPYVKAVDPFVVNVFCKPSEHSLLRKNTR